jgi:multidrug efflux pump subunit AcrB
MGRRIKRIPKTNAEAEDEAEDEAQQINPAEPTTFSVIDEEASRGWLISGYRKLLLGALRMKRRVVLVAFLLFLGSLGIMSQTGRELFPPIDAGQFTILVRAPSGTRIEKSEEIIKEIENVIVEVIGDPGPGNPTADTVYQATKDKYAGGQDRTLTADEVARATKDSHCQTLISNIGVLMDWPAAYTPNTGAMDSFVLVQIDADSGARSVFSYVDELREKLNAKFPDVEFAFDTGGILTAALNMGEPAPIHLQIAGRDIATAHDIADKLVESVKSVAGTTDVRIAQRADYPMIEVEIDRVAAADRGVTPEIVMKSLVSATNSSINFDPAFWISPQNGNHYFLGTQYYEDDINSLDTLKYILVKGEDADSPMVYLQDVAKLHTNRKVPNVINHRNIVRVTDVFANVKTGYDLGTVIANIERELRKPNASLKLIPVKDSRGAAAKYPEWLQNTLRAIGLNEYTRYKFDGKQYAGFNLEIQGEIRSMRDSFVDFALGLVLAAVLVYLVMVGQFRSFVDPFIVLVTVPMGFIGVALVFFFTDTRLNIQSFMGIIMMIGIVVEYTIVLLDFANHRLADGATTHEAIVDAAIVRFRPILMTSVTTILALLPMAIGFAGGEADVPLARTIVGGVIAATLLPKFVVPCLYVMIKRPPKTVSEEEPGWT